MSDKPIRVPVDVHAKLKELAKANFRSIIGQLAYMVEEWPKIEAAKEAALRKVAKVEPDREAEKREAQRAKDEYAAKAAVYKALAVRAKNYGGIGPGWQQLPSPRIIDNATANLRRLVEEHEGNPNIAPSFEDTPEGQAARKAWIEEQLGESL